MIQGCNDGTGLFTVLVCHHSHERSLHTPWIPGGATALGQFLGNNLDFLIRYGSYPRDGWSSLLACLADALLQGQD